MKKILFFVLCIASLQLSAQTWTQLAAPPSSYVVRNHPVTFSIGNFAYIGTGLSNSSALLNDFYRYDPSNDSWTSLPNFPGGARGFAYGVENDGKGYLGFGLGTSNNYYNDLWEFDPVTNNWTQLASCPGSGRRHPAMVTTTGKIFVGCGDGPTGNLKDWWEYDIASDTWTKRDDLPAPRRHHPYFFSIKDEAYVGFGHNGNNIYKDMYKFNPSTLSWSAIASLPAQGRVAGTQFSYGGKGYLLSGQGEDHLNLPTGEFWEYDPATNSWTSLTPHPGTGRWAPGSFLINGTLYLTSGAGQGNAQIDERDIWKFDMPSFAVSVDDVEKANIKFYPNPATDRLTVSADVHTAEIEVYSIYGAKASVRVNRRTTNEAILDVSGLSAGVYILHLKNEDGIRTQQFVKQY